MKEENSPKLPRDQLFQEMRRAAEKASKETAEQLARLTAPPTDLEAAIREYMRKATK